MKVALLTMFVTPKIVPSGERIPGGETRMREGAPSVVRAKGEIGRKSGIDLMVLVSGTQDWLLPLMNIRGMHVPAIAMRMVRTGVSHERLAMSTRLWNIVNACRNGLTILPLGRSITGCFAMEKEDKELVKVGVLECCETFSPLCSAIRSRKMSSIVVPRIS